MSDVQAKLSEFDFVFVLDASGSMTEDDCPGGKTRWEYMQESLFATMREIEKVDADGVGLVIFSGANNITVVDGVTTKNAKDIIAQRRPIGSTATAEALQAAFKLAGKSDKKDFIQVWTDGTPDDEAAVERVLRDQIALQETDDALSVQFVQVGHAAGVPGWFTKLDDNLGAKFDAVDCKTMLEVEQFASSTDLVIAGIEG